MQNRVEQHYDANPEHEWNRLDRHRLEFALTMRALALAEQGHKVTLLDLSMHLGAVRPPALYWP